MSNKLLTLLLSLMMVSVSQATVDVVQWSTDVDIDLTAVGTLDWATWGDGDGTNGALGNVSPNYKLGGSGINKTLSADWDITQLYPSDPGYEDTDYTSGIWTWTDSATLAPGSHAPDGVIDGVGMRGWIQPLGDLSFLFDGTSTSAMAKILLRRDAALEIWADQGGQSVLVDPTDENGTATIYYTGLEPMTIRVHNASDVDAVRLRGFAATLTPEPTTIVLLGLGGLLLRRRRK